jgi:DNA gyrase subunit A
MLSTKELIHYFVKHRHDVILRRTKFDLDQAEKRAHILQGLIIASDNIDEVIAIIKASPNPDAARERLMERFNLSEIQSRAIVDMRLRQLTGLEQDKLRAEYKEIMDLIDYLKSVLADEALQMKIIKDELLEIKEKYGDDRRSEIVPNAEEFNPEDFYADDEMVITISHMGYIKRTPLTEFRRQNRGGTGAKGGSTRDEDFIEHLYIATMHNTMLFFTSKGKCFWLKVYSIPEGSRISKGRAMQNLINIEPDDKVRAFINVKNLNDPDYINHNYIVLCTTKGIIKKTSLKAYSRPRANGVNAITVREGDELLEARMTNGNYQIMLAIKSGRAIRFPESSVRPMGRTASGVRGIRLADDKNDFVVGMITIENKEKDILVVSEKGYGKRSDIDKYRITNRGGKGVRTIKITEKTGSLIALKDVTDNHDLMIITQFGNILRSPVKALRVMGRATQGVRLINLKENDIIASVACVLVNEDTEEIIDAENVPDDENIPSKNENGKEFED